MKLIATLILAILLGKSISVCVTDGTAGYPLPTITNSDGDVVCPPGFHCPHFDPSNSSTFPVYCVPTAECQVQRMQGKLCKTSMGRFEPILCPEGTFCPDATSIVECPSGYFCRVGQQEPKKCPPLSICKAGSYGPTTFTGIVCFVVLGAAITILRWCYLTRWRPHPAWGSYPQAAPRGPTSSSPFSGEACVDDVVSEQTRAVLVSGFTKARDLQPIQIEFSNLSVALRDSERTLVAAVSGSLRPGTVTAILGPSGSGKTVLLKALLGRTDPSWSVRGLLTVNGDAQVAKYRSMIGSVPQEDVLHTELTVYRNVLYAAELRLPSDWTSEQRTSLIRAVLESLGIAHVADVLIGDVENRGVSGGQRKRASIGVELVTAPQALLLDEPTKGLDSNTALELVNALRRVAVETELTVGMAVNQPRAEIWNALDELLILGNGGRTVFQGNRRDIVAYMEQKFGLMFSPESNPADVVLDAVSARGDEMADVWTAHNVGPVSPDAPEDRSDTRDEIPWNGATILNQVRIAHVRYIEKQLSTISTLFIEVGVSFILGAVLGFSLSDNTLVGIFKYPFGRISLVPLSAMPPQMHMYAFMSLGLATGTAGVNVFVNDKGTYNRAVACGSSRLAHYVGTVSASWYRLVLVALAFSSPYHLLAKSSAPFGQYFALFLVFSWVMYAVAGIVALIADQRTAPLISGLSSVVFACFSGFINFPSGMKKMSFCFWAAQVLQEWMFQETNDVFEETSTEWGWGMGEKGVSFGVMIGMGCFYHIIACIVLISLGKP